jgi:hypothetical protein
VELEYKALVGYGFLKETNAKINWNKEEEEKNITVNTRNLLGPAREFTEIFKNPEKINFYSSPLTL